MRCSHGQGWVFMYIYRCLLRCVQMDGCALARREIASIERGRESTETNVESISASDVERRPVYLVKFCM